MERNQSFHNLQVWSAKLWRPTHDYSFTWMTVQWEKPHNQTVTNNKLCAYKLHYYRGNSDIAGSTPLILQDVTKTSYYKIATNRNHLMYYCNIFAVVFARHCLTEFTNSNCNFAAFKTKIYIADTH